MLVSQASFITQPMASLQPHIPLGAHSRLSAPIMQSWQVVPVFPHAVLLTPGWHIPVVSQHPVRQGKVELHPTHVPLEQLGVDGLLQSADELHCTQVPLGEQSFAARFFVQSVHALPCPQAVGLVPDWHVPPLPLQQPPLQAV